MGAQFACVGRSSLAGRAELGDIPARRCCGSMRRGHAFSSGVAATRCVGWRRCRRGRCTSTSALGSVLSAATRFKIVADGALLARTCAHSSPMRLMRSVGSEAGFDVGHEGGVLRWADRRCGSSPCRRRWQRRSVASGHLRAESAGVRSWQSWLSAPVLKQTGRVHFCAGSA